MPKRRAPQLPREPKSPQLTTDRQARVRGLLNEGARKLMERQPGEAVPLLLQALALDPGNADVALNLGSAYILQGKHAQAVPLLEQASRLDPDNATIWANLGAAYLGKLPIAFRQEQDRAIEAFRHALILDPVAPHVHYNLGLIYLERKDLFSAAEHFEAALNTDPTDTHAQLWLDRIRRGDFEREEPQG